MGACINKEKQLPPDNRIREDLPPRSQQIRTGLQISEGPPNKVTFHHTPLQSCPYLYQKFKSSASLPEQVNLAFMILGAQINLEENTVNIAYINEKQVNIYFILGGEEGLSNTGLTVEVDNPRYVEKFNITQPSPEKGDSLLVVPRQMKQDRIILVIEPVLKQKQSIYILYRYEYNPKERKYHKKSQSLQWSNLAFNLQEIYGAQNEFKCNAGEVCSICLSSPSNIIFTPCRHMCICRDCSKAKNWKTCPICRAEVRALIQYG